MSEQAVFDALKYRIDVDIYGHRRYYNAAGQPHREHGPAVEHVNGAKFWYRPAATDGPAVVWGIHRMVAQWSTSDRSAIQPRGKPWCLNKKCLKH